MSEEEKKAIEQNRFDTSSGEGEYKITFETNNIHNYLFMQELARLFIDRNYKPREFERLKLNNEYLQKDCNILKEQIEKQNKIIDKMAEDIILLKECGWLTNITNKQDTIEFYTKLVEEETNESKNNN